MEDLQILINRVITGTEARIAALAAQDIARAQDHPEKVIAVHAPDPLVAAQDPAPDHLVELAIATRGHRRETTAVLALKVHAERDLLPDHVRNLVPNQDSPGLIPNLAQGHQKIENQDLVQILPDREGLQLLTGNKVQMEPAMIKITVPLKETTMTVSMMTELKTMGMIKIPSCFFFYLECCAVITF